VHVLTIDRQFYKLSKAHHPDLHPDDNTAAQRFVKISEAHATLGSPEKKARYDRDFLRVQPTAGGTSPTPAGSFSSASHAGSRPASGLSRRRTQFRGPPPSFYRSGGWGQQSEKRSEAASRASHIHEAAQGGPAGPAGTGPGGFTSGFDNDVRHFDQAGHHRTHSEIERTRHKARRKRRVNAAELESEYGGGSVLFNFVMISGILGVIFGISGAIAGTGGAERKQKLKEDIKA
jgi:curved DNA-binding protein CbpA